MTDKPELIRDIGEVLLRNLNKKPSAIRELKGGHNSRVFRVECDDGAVFAVKAYFQSAQDQRDRMGAEFRALRFLKAEGVEEIPAALTSDAVRQVAVYEFVNGQSVRSDEIGDAEIDQAVAFLGRLKQMADLGRAVHFPPASEACFSIAALLDNLAERFHRLDKAAATYPALRDFLQNELTPARNRAEQRCRILCHDLGIPVDQQIPMSERTLSPSDFGFHNALRAPNGRLVFFDFEYFGWDDPAKTVVDFLLHPGMQLSATLKQRFFSGMIVAFAGVPKFQHRVRVVHPLYVLKWCTILLNEFTLEHRARRCFANTANGAWNMAAQLEKARSMLATAMHDKHDFLWDARFHCA